mgnify:CR=1 FL=1
MGFKKRIKKLPDDFDVQPTFYKVIISILSTMESEQESEYMAFLISTNIESKDR